MSARSLFPVAGVLMATLLWPVLSSAQSPPKPATPFRPDVSLTLRLDRAPDPASSKGAQPLAERALPWVVLSPGQWKQVVDDFSAESKPVLMHFFWTGQPMTIERHGLYYSRSSLSYTKGIIFGEMAHGRMDLGLYKGRVTLDQNRMYGMGPRPFSNPIPGNDIRFFRNPILEDVDKVFVMLRFHLTLPKR